MANIEMLCWIYEFIYLHYRVTQVFVLCQGHLFILLPLQITYID